jgi:NDP-sugar pyrophosphorylase family protein
MDKMKISRQQLRKLIREQLEQSSGTKYRVGDVVKVRAPGAINYGQPTYTIGPVERILQIVELPGERTRPDGRRNPYFYGVEPQFMGTEYEEEYARGFTEDQIISDI